MITSPGKTGNMRVLVVDDSSLVRKILERELNKKEGIEVVGTAADPYIARELIAKLRPDILTLDVEMPRMDGITFLRKLMAAHPLPVIILSSLAEKGGAVYFEALEAGAIEVVRKPGTNFSVEESCDDIATFILNASKHPISSKPPTRAIPAPKQIRPASSALSRTTQKILAVGASTGGVQALNKVFPELPASTPGIVVVQHMPPKFTSMLAERLNELCAMRVKEAQHGDLVSMGQILIAPGGKHMTLTRSGAQYSVLLNEDPQVFHQRPSVDVLFDSVAKYAGSNSIGVLLTGMGEDGAAGLLNMKEVGAKTIAQDEKSSVVFGMPKAAIDRGAAEQVLSLNHVSSAMLKLVDVTRV